MEIDYRLLLVKYMAAVMGAEGVSFSDEAHYFGTNNEEEAELKTIEGEASQLKRTIG